MKSIEIIINTNSKAIADVFTNVAITCAMIRFMLICNFGYNNFTMPKAKIHKTIALLYRTLGHNTQMLDNIKGTLEEKYGDSNIAGTLLLS